MIVVVFFHLFSVRIVAGLVFCLSELVVSPFSCEWKWGNPLVGKKTVEWRQDYFLVLVVNIVDKISSLFVSHSYLVQLQSVQGASSRQALLRTLASKNILETHGQVPALPRLPLPTPAEDQGIRSWQGKWSSATEIHSVVGCTTALCSTLLNFPLLRACRRSWGRTYLDFRGSRWTTPKYKNNYLHFMLC